MQVFLETALQKKYIIITVLFTSVLFLVAVYPTTGGNALRAGTFKPSLSLLQRIARAKVRSGTERSLTFERRTECKNNTRNMCHSTSKSLIVTFWEEKSKKFWLSQNILTAFPLHAFEHIVFVYDNSSWLDHPGHAHFIWIHVRGQHRYWYLKRFLSSTTIKPYEYIWLVDNDAQPDFSPLQYQCVMKELRIELSAPGRLSGATSHNITRRNDAFVHKVGRWTDFVETGPLFVGTSLAWRCIYTLIDPVLAVGWGIDMIWCRGLAEQCVTPANSRHVCAILDVFGLHHQSERIQSTEGGQPEIPLYSIPYRRWLMKQQILGALAENNDVVDMCRL